MYSKTVAGILLCFLVACYGNFTHAGEQHKETTTAIIPAPAVIQTIPLPPGFTRKAANPRSFAAWLRKISLKDNKTVYLYNGKMKTNQGAQFAVLDIPVGNKDLQQCADAIIRLRAEYLFSAGRFDEIFFRIMPAPGTSFQHHSPPKILPGTCTVFLECVVRPPWPDR